MSQVKLTALGSNPEEMTEVKMEAPTRVVPARMTPPTVREGPALPAQVRRAWAEALRRTTTELRRRMGTGQVLAGLDMTARYGDSTLCLERLLNPPISHRRAGLQTLEEALRAQLEAGQRLTLIWGVGAPTPGLTIEITSA